MEPDADLIERFRAGDAHAFGKLYERHRRRLFGYAIALSRDEAWSADLVQQVWLTWIDQVDQIELRTDLPSYLLCAVRNRFLNDVRRRGVEKRALAAQRDATPRFVVSGNPAVRAEQVEHLNQALAGLPDEQREVLLLKGPCNLTFREVAELTGVGSKTIQSRHRLGLDKLRAALNGKIDD